MTTRAIEGIWFWTKFVVAAALILSLPGLVARAATDNLTAIGFVAWLVVVLVADRRGEEWARDEGINWRPLILMALAMGLPTLAGVLVRTLTA